MKNFIEFIKKNPEMVICSIVSLFFCYGFRIFNYSITIDSVSMAVDYDLMFNTFISSGRFGYALTKKLFGLNQLDSNFSLILMGITILLYSYVMCYVFNTLNKVKTMHKLQNIVFTTMFISAPIFAEQYNYTLQSFEIAFAMLLLAISLYLSVVGITENKRLLNILSILLLTYAVATYQSFVVLYISGAISFYLYISEYSTKKQCHNFALKQLLIWGASLVLYYILNFIIQSMTGMRNTYVGSLILWKTEGIKMCVKNLSYFIFSVMSGKGIFYNSTYIVITIGLICYSIKVFKEKREAWILNIVAIIGLLLSPFLISILMGTAGPIRAQMAIPFVTAFGLSFLLRYLKQNRAIKFIVITYCFFSVFQQCKETSQLFYSDYMRYNQDVQLATEIGYDIQKNYPNENNNLPVIFVGWHQTQLPPSCVKGEIIGHSFFEWGHNSPWGNLPYLLQFFNSLGFRFTPGVVDSAELESTIKNMDTWPKENSIKLINDVVVVKLSDE